MPSSYHCIAPKSLTTSSHSNRGCCNICCLWLWYGNSIVWQCVWRTRRGQSSQGDNAREGVIKKFVVRTRGPERSLFMSSINPLSEHSTKLR
eukprot:scaffold249330_cov73-Cyclotella_meneghiniana.AAC.1